MNPNRFRRDVAEISIGKDDFLRFFNGEEVAVVISNGHFLKVGDLVSCRLGIIDSIAEVKTISYASRGVSKDTITLVKAKAEA
ncbi:MAG TPA: hypothetical protein PLZ99_02620 [Parcubacteria group bacterium]|jgi:hypothetical protein|nr:hypothetical protein [Parcubacteria group bacterium]